MDDGQWPLKRKRLVTTCNECHRRKQKCNRARPCNVCIVRDVPEKCSYGDETIQPEHQTSIPSSDGSRNQVSNNQVDAVKLLQNGPGNLPDQMGIAFTHDSDAIVKKLQESMGNLRTGEYFLSSYGQTLSPVLRAKYASILTQLPSHEMVVMLVDYYFTEANWYFATIEKYYFDSLYHSWLEISNPASQGSLENVSRELQHFPALLFQVMAVSLQFVPTQSPVAQAFRLRNLQEIDNLSEEYSSAGVEVVHILGRHNPSLSAVQHDVMRSLWLKNCSRGIESWSSLCDAVRKAQELGLHRQNQVTQAKDGNLEENLARIWYDEYKRRLWATLFSWDGHMALMLGRPRTINVKDCTTNRPMDCDIPEDPTKFVPLSTTSQDPPSHYSSSIFRYDLAHKVHTMLSNEINTRHVLDYSLVGDIHNEIVALVRALHPAYRLENPDLSWDEYYPHLLKHRLHISVSVNSALVALHRSHVGTHGASRQAAFEAALASLQSQSQFVEVAGETFHRVYMLSVYTIEAGLFLCSALEHYQPNDAQYLNRIHLSLQGAITRLTLIRDKNTLARTGLLILKACYQRICSSSMTNVILHPPRKIAAYDELPIIHAVGNGTNDSWRNVDNHDTWEHAPESTRTHENQEKEPNSSTANVEQDDMCNFVPEANNNYASLSPLWFDDYNAPELHVDESQIPTTAPNHDLLSAALDQDTILQQNLLLDDIYPTPDSWRQLDFLGELDPAVSFSESTWSSLLN